METHMDHRGGKKGLVKKPTGFMSSSRYIIQELDRKCTGGHDHIPLVGGRVAGAAIYTQALCECICRGTAKRKRMDHRDIIIVNTGKMNADQDEPIVQSSTSRITRPTGYHPEHWNDEWHEATTCEDVGLRTE